MPKCTVIHGSTRAFTAMVIVWSALTAVFSSGCATAQNHDSGAYRESASDLVNRAPRAFTLPAQTTGGPLDAAAMREQADYHFAVAEAYSLDGVSNKAIEEYKLASLYDSKSASIRLRLASEYVKQALISEAMEQAKQAIELDPTRADAFLLLGGLQSALRMYAEALDTYRKAQALAPENSEAAMFIGALLAEQKRYPESIQIFEALTKRQTNSAKHLAWYYMGRVRLEQDLEKNKAAAERDMVAAIKEKPSFVDAVSALGALYESTGRRAATIRLYREFQDKYGPDAGVAESLSKLYLEDQKYDEAFAQLEVIESNDPENLTARMKIAFILIEKKRYREAATKLEDLLAVAPESDKIRFYLGAVNEELKDNAAAVVHFEKIPPSSHYYAEAVVHAAYLSKLAGDSAKAISTIEAGLKNKDDYPQFYSLYASFLDDLKEYRKAARILERATARFPAHAQLRFFLGSMQDRIGDYDGMVVSMNRVLEIDAKHVQAMNYLAYVYAERGAKLEEAERLVRKAMLLQPADGYIMDTLGWVLYKRGSFTEAVQILETAIKLVPNEAVIAEHLGDAYYKYQLPDKAKKMYLKATEADANPDNVRKIRGKISAIDAQVQPSITRLPAAVPAEPSAATGSQSGQ